MGRIPTGLAIASLVALALGLPPAGAAAGPRAESSGRTDAVGTLIDTVRVRTVDNAFRPRTLTVVRGTQVRWINRGDNVHTSTSNKDIWDSGLLDPGEAFSRVFRRGGTFRYHCTVHPAVMRGVITVT